MTEPTGSFYVTGGTLKPGEPSYVERRADTELFESLLAGELCYVLTARQMGKSSLMARTAKRLELVGVASAIVDLTQIGSERGSQAAAQWYFGVANKIHQQLKIAEPLRPWWQERADLSSVQRLTDFFREIVLAQHTGKVVVFVDEIDSTIGLPFADDFFAAIRACFNARATEPDFERLTFVLLGVATPDQLIRDQTRTPFNIGKRIDLTDFSSEEAQGLASGLHADLGEAGERLERVLHWTGGHPYLTQALCRSVREKGEAGTAEQAVDPRVQELFLASQAQREETNLKHARARLERPGAEGRRLLQLYQRVRQGQKVSDQPTSPLFAQLKLAGVVKATDEGLLSVRNRIYEAVFTPAWVKSAMPTDVGRGLAAATLAATLATLVVWYTTFQPRPYEEALRAAIKDDGYNGAIEAYSELRANPFSRSQATELMQQFWEQRALKYALAGKRDESLLSCLQGLTLQENRRLRKKAKNLVGSDYELLQFTLRHKGSVSAVAFSRPDGRILATGNRGSAAQIWNAKSGTPLGPLKAPLRYLNDIRTIGFSPDGKTFVTGASDGTVLVFNGEDVRAYTLFRYSYGINTVAFSPDGRTFAFGSYKVARILDIRVKRPLASPMPLLGNVVAVAFSLDGRSITTGATSRAVRTWDAHSGKPLAPPLLLPGQVATMAFSPDGRAVATAAWDGIAQVWDIRTGKPLAPAFQHEGLLNAVAFSPGGRAVATGSRNNTARIWDAHTARPLGPPLQHQDSITTLAFSPDDKFAATGSDDKTTRVWKVESADLRRAPFQHERFVTATAFSPDGRSIVTGSRDHTARVWNAQLAKPLTPPLQHEEAVNTVAFSPDGQSVATGASDNTVRLWDVHTGKLLAPLLQGGSPAYAVAFSPDGHTVAAGFADLVRIWDTHTRSLKASLQSRGFVFALAFSPDGRYLATGCSELNSQIWDTRTGQPLTTELLHPDTVVTVAFSPDGRYLATGTASSTVHLWNAMTGKPLSTPIRLQDSARTVAFSPNGQALIAATDHWLNTYSWDGKSVAPRNSQLLQGFWKGGLRFLPGCEGCLQVTPGDTGNSFHIETLDVNEPNDPPIQGDPKELLKKWQERLGMTFDKDMKPVPR